MPTRRARRENAAGHGAELERRGRRAGLREEIASDPDGNVRSGDRPDREFRFGDRGRSGPPTKRRR